MKILYALQGTGNGHIARAREIVPLLKQRAEVDVLISGIQSDVKAQFDIDYRLYGMSFMFGKKGGVDFWKTWKSLRLNNLHTDIRQTPVEKYDLVINDFEPVSARACKLKNVPCHALSHQASFLSKLSPRPKKFSFFKWGTEWLYEHYAPVKNYIGFHFKSYDSFIHTPVIRKEIRDLEVSNTGHYTVYLQSMDDTSLINIFSYFSDIKFEVFSKHTKQAYRKNNVHIYPIENKTFIQSLANCEGIIGGGGFESPAEALHLGKKVLAIPIRGQYEQYCNAEALHELGAARTYNLHAFKKSGMLEQWLLQSQAIQFSYPDETEMILDTIIRKYENK